MEHIKKILAHCGAGSFANEKIKYLGEGAWNIAYFAKYSDKSGLVVRIPKQKYYEQSSKIDEVFWQTAYAGTGYYYKKANEIQSLICPPEYYYNVSQELTYTVETYMGESLQLSKIKKEEASNYGQQIGAFFREMNEIKPSLKGFGFLHWNGDSLEGQLPNEEAFKTIDEEREEYIGYLDELSNSKLSFDRKAIRSRLNSILSCRTIQHEPFSLVNRDVSPGNIIIRNNKVSLIDPLPVIYNGTVNASNLINSYRSLIMKHEKSPYFDTSHFKKHSPIYNSLADGFTKGYTREEKSLKSTLNNERFLMLLALTYQHFELLSLSELSPEAKQQLGNSRQIKNRMYTLLYELETYIIN